MSPHGAQSADQLNRECQCVGVDVPAMRARLGSSLMESHAHLFSELPVFMTPAHARDMRATAAAVERVIALPAFQSTVLARAPEIASHVSPARGVFSGFDFHITPEGPKLIEINTNAGGAVLNAIARGFHENCCPAVAESLESNPAAESLLEQIIAMFCEEWRMARGGQPLRHVAIVDEKPAGQYLYPEFVEFQGLLQSRDIEVTIADARELVVAGDELRIGGRRIDLVYNRSTDFYFADPAHASLGKAFRHDLAVVTPNPRAHALYADKRNFVLLGDAGFLASCGADARDVALLARTIPATREVVDSGAWWEDRRRWFFKPNAGFGSRGSYRGDKMTRRVFAEVAGGGYVAQELTPPGERHRSVEDERRVYKVDVRAYAYRGRVQQFAARLYQGQTTNFRTAGGGFAPVYVTSEGVEDCPGE